MTRLLRLVAALAAAVMLGALTLQPAFAATRAKSGPIPTPDQAQKLSQLLQELNQQQSTVNSLATQVENEQASIAALDSKVAADKQKEQLLNKQMGTVARIEYERPALTLTTVIDAKNLGQLLSGVAQARLIARHQKSLVDAAQTLKAKDEQDRAQAQLQLDKINKQKTEAVALTATTEAEVSQLQKAQQATQAAQSSQTSQSSQTASTGSTRSAASQQSAPAAQTASVATGTLRAGPSNPNRFDPGQCTWYVAQIYSIPWMGNAGQWPYGAAADGYPEGSTPEVGAIMVSADSWAGHVSVVTSVTSYNQWTVTEMNYRGPYGVDSRSVTRGSSLLITFIS
jgi:surface antigen